MMEEMWSIVHNAGRKLSAGEVIRPDMSVRLWVTFVRGIVLCVTPANDLSETEMSTEPVRERC